MKPIVTLIVGLAAIAPSSSFADERLQLSDKPFVAIVAGELDGGYWVSGLWGRMKYRVSCVIAGDIAIGKEIGVLMDIDPHKLRHLKRGDDRTVPILILYPCPERFAKEVIGPGPKGLPKFEAKIIRLTTSGALKRLQEHFRQDAPNKASRAKP